MTVGPTPTKALIDQQLAGLAIQLASICGQIRELNTQVNGGGNGAGVLTNVGYSTATNAENPGSQSDNAYALYMLGLLFNVAGCYYGSVQQGGNGGTGAILFNFDTGLAPLRLGS